MRHGALILASMAVLAHGCGGGSSAADGGSDAAADAQQYDSARLEDGPVDAGGDSSPDCGLRPTQTDGPVFVPGPIDIQFAAVHPLPTGEQILFNDWSPSPNTLYSMTPDGQTITEVFRAYRIWSMGVSRAHDRIAFSSGDPDQEGHYGLVVGDSIQHTFLYDVGTQTATLLSNGNLNDECLTFGPNDTALYLCRRYDFQETCSGRDLVSVNRGWRLGRIDLPGNAFTFLTPDVDFDSALAPQPTPDGNALFYGRTQGAYPSWTHAIWKMALPAGTTELWKEQASSPVLSPDGTRLVYQNGADGYTLYIANVDGSQATQIFNQGNASEAVFSPDGTQVAFLPFDDSVCCIQAVKADGSEATAPRCLHSCASGGEFITELDWIVR